MSEGSSDAPPATNTRRLLSVALTTVTVAALGPIVASVSHYRDAATSVSRRGAIILWSHVIASVGFVLLAIVWQRRADPSGAAGLAISAWLASGVFVWLRPNVAAHSSSDGLFVFGSLLGLLLVAVLAMSAFFVRFARLAIAEDI